MGQGIRLTTAPIARSAPIDLGVTLRPKPQALLPRKEVIQPQLPLRLPCYDFVPVTSPTLGAYLPQAGWYSDFRCCRLP